MFAPTRRDVLKVHLLEELKLSESILELISSQTPDSVTSLGITAGLLLPSHALSTQLCLCRDENHLPPDDWASTSASHSVSCWDSYELQIYCSSLQEQVEEIILLCWWLCSLHRFLFLISTASSCKSGCDQHGPSKWQLQQVQEDEWLSFLRSYLQYGRWKLMNFGLNMSEDKHRFQFSF